MQHRVNLFVMFLTCLGLLAHTGSTVKSYWAMYIQLPGGIEGLPGLTRTVLGALGWLATWWPAVLLLGAGVAFGAPALLRRSPGGARVLDMAGAWLSKYHGTVVVLFVAAMFSTNRVVDLALDLPHLRIIWQLTGR